MQKFILTLQKAFWIFTWWTVPLECLTVDNMTVANVSHSASMTHIHTVKCPIE